MEEFIKTTWQHPKKKAGKNDSKSNLTNLLTSGGKFAKVLIRSTE